MAATGLYHRAPRIIRLISLPTCNYGESTVGSSLDRIPRCAYPVAQLPPIYTSRCPRSARMNTRHRMCTLNPLLYQLFS